MRPNRQHEHVIVGRPSREHTIAAVKVATAHQLKLGAGQSIASRLAASVKQLIQCSAGRLSTPSSERVDLSLRGQRQVDDDDRFASLAGGSSSSRRARSSLVTRPARISSIPAWASEPRAA
jgi:hypothetical protein